MALNLLNSVPTIGPMRDPFWVECYCNGYMTGTATAAVYTLDVVSNPADGDTFSITLGDAMVVFTWLTAGDSTGTTITIGADTTVSRTNLLAALEGNWQINQWFAITAGSPITLTRREVGVAGAAFENTTPVAMSWAETNAGGDATYATNYKAALQVWVEKVWDSGNYIPLPPVVADPDEALRVRWNLRPLLGHMVQHTWPDYDEDRPIRCVDLQRRYYFHRYELMGDPPLPQKILGTPVRKVWAAGSRNIERNTIGHVFIWAQRTDVPTPWLTYRGRAGKHEVSTAQQHYLSHYRAVPRVADQPMQLVATVYYSDGTNSSAVALTDSTITWAQGEVATWPTGFDTLSLGTWEPTKIPVRYTVQLVSNSTPRSEVHTFHIVDPDANEQYLEYVNSLGVVESIRCIGRWVRGMVTEHTEVNRALTMVNTVLPSEQKSTHTQLLNGVQGYIEISTGYMSRGELNVLVDALLSPERRLLMPRFGTRGPVRLVDAEHVVQVQGDPAVENLSALNIRLLEGAPEMAWSDRVSLGALPAVDDDEEI